MPTVSHLLQHFIILEEAMMDTLCHDCEESYCTHGQIVLLQPRHFVSSHMSSYDLLHAVLVTEPSAWREEE